MTREEIEQLYVEEPNCFETGREEQWYKVGLKEGLAAADSHPQWIPVEERLPEDIGGFSDEVMICTKNKRHELAMYNYISNCWCSQYSDDEITHWMEIQPPRKEE